MANNEFSRRDFVRRAGAALAAPYVITSTALGTADTPAPSQRITMGTIGLGGRGNGDMGALLSNADVQMLAVCDVVRDKREKGKIKVDGVNGNSDCTAYRDFRDLLARKDIDAVLIATGDHWHAHASMLAAEAGKDVYSEKPCAISIALAQRLADTIRRTGRVFQAGTQRRSISNFIHAIEMAQTGKLGNLHTLHASIYALRDSHAWLPAGPLPDREVVDCWRFPILNVPFP